MIGGKEVLVDDRRGKVFVKDVQRNKESLRVRYQEAKRMLRGDANLRAEFENRLADRLGRPRPHVIERKMIGRRRVGG